MVEFMRLRPNGMSHPILCMHKHYAQPYDLLASEGYRLTKEYSDAVFPRELTSQQKHIPPSVGRLICLNTTSPSSPSHPNYPGDRTNHKPCRTSSPTTTLCFVCPCPQPYTTRRAHPWHANEARVYSRLSGSHLAQHTAIITLARPDDLLAYAQSTRND